MEARLELMGAWAGGGGMTKGDVDGSSYQVAWRFMTANQ